MKYFFHYLYRNHKTQLVKRILLLIVLSQWCYYSAAQERIPNKIVISGTVYGYKFDPSVKLLNKESAQLEGSIGGVTVIVYSDGSKISTTKTSGNGNFNIELPLENSMKIEYSKEKYVSGSFQMDFSKVPEDMRQTGLIFENVELAMNSYVTEKTKDGRPFGTLSYDVATRRLVFNEIIYDDKKKLFGDNKDNTPMNLMNKSIKKNIDNNSVASEISVDNTSVVDNNASTKTKTNNSVVGTNEGEITNAGNETSVSKLSTLPRLNLETIAASDIDARQAEINKAWEQLEKDKLLAITPEDFALIQAREELLLAAEKELEDAKKFISLQQDQIAAQRFKILLLILLLVVLAVAGFFIFRYARQKAILNKELEAKNKKINESLRYALRIQQSVLLTEGQVKNWLPESFIFYQPLDIVSGDFYWVSEVDQKIIFAVADCTGHGVPGAFMSLIGNTLLNQLVNEKKITEASQILEKLNEGIITALRQSESEQNNQDGMDISLCVIDKNKKTVQVAGAMNAVYIVKNNEVHTIEPTLKAIGGISPRKKSKEIRFESTLVQLKKNDWVYLTSDGYMDQFGGPENLKFNLPNFKQLLIEAATKPAIKQKEEFNKKLNDWKGKSKQIDDILVVGFTV